jgi:hypothetical protein
VIIKMLITQKGFFSTFFLKVSRLRKIVDTIPMHLYHRSHSRSPRPYSVSDPLSTPSSPPTPSPAPYDTPKKPVMRLRGPFNTSPRLLRGYFREAQLFKDSVRKIGQHSRFQPVVPKGFGPSLLPLLD